LHRYDAGLAWDSAKAAYDAHAEQQSVRAVPTARTLRVSGSAKWTSGIDTCQVRLGGITGFWQQAKSKNIVLALEVVSSSGSRELRHCRVLRPTLHTTAKPQYVPAATLRAKYFPVKEDDPVKEDARELWEAQYCATEKKRVKKVGGAHSLRYTSRVGPHSRRYRSRVGAHSRLTAQRR
jgi:hypothetical protein